MCLIFWNNKQRPKVHWSWLRVTSAVSLHVISSRHCTVASEHWDFPLLQRTGAVQSVWERNVQMYLCVCIPRYQQTRMRTCCLQQRGCLAKRHRKDVRSSNWGGDNLLLYLSRHGRYLFDLLALYFWPWLLSVHNKVSPPVVGNRASCAVPTKKKKVFLKEFRGYNFWLWRKSLLSTDWNGNSRWTWCHNQQKPLPFSQRSMRTGPDVTNWSCLDSLNICWIEPCVEKCCYRLVRREDFRLE